VAGVISNGQLIPAALPWAEGGDTVDVAATEADGTASRVARADHRHAHGSGYLPDAHHAQHHALQGGDHDDIATSPAPTTGQALVWNGTHWAPASAGSAGLLYVGHMDGARVGMFDPGDRGYLEATDPDNVPFFSMGAIYLSPNSEWYKLGYDGDPQIRLVTVAGHAHKQVRIDLETFARAITHELIDLADLARYSGLSYGTELPDPQTYQPGQLFLLQTGTYTWALYARDPGIGAYGAWQQLAGGADPGYQLTSEKGVANGYAGLGADGKVPAGQLPAFSSSFLGLSDTPDSFAGQGSKVVRVKSAEDGLEFATATGGSGADFLVVQVFS
jgi:hypothetical protein